jgi:hypothetical protein
MGHPDRYAVGLLGFGMMAGALLGIFALTLIACANARRVLPQRRARAIYWIGMALMVPLALGTFPLAPQLMRALAVIASFGWDAYAGGLRVVNKHGLLSDGRFLSVFWTAATGVGCIVLDFLWVMPITSWHCHFNPGRRAGEQVSDGSVRTERGAANRSVLCVVPRRRGPDGRSLPWTAGHDA